MDAKYANMMFSFEPKATDDCEILCSECNQWSHIADWEECSTFCEACGDHYGIQCPRCGHAHDAVWNKDQKSRAIGASPMDSQEGK